MASIKISQLTAAESATGTQEFEINDSGTSKKVTGSQIATFIESEISSDPSFTGQVSLADGTESLPSLTNTGDTNTGVYFPAADAVSVSTGGSERMRIDASGNVGIGTSSPAAQLHVSGSTSAGVIQLGGTSTTGYYAQVNQNANNFQIIANGDQAYRASLGTNNGTGYITFLTANLTTNNTERMRIDAAGNVGIGTDTPTTALDVVGIVAATGGFRETGSNSTTSEGVFTTYRAGTGVQTGNFVRIRSVGDGAGNATQMIFDVNSSEAMRIDDAGALLVGKNVSNFATAGAAFTSNGVLNGTASGTAVLQLNRLASDGNIVGFFQDSNLEGSISVTGTTVSYNGGHLSRWAQFTDNSRPDLLKGTVMSNLDQMSNWDNEDNEQLNCIKVSDAEGDANVAGVFVAWDSEDDGYNDILLAMTGDMVIRIGAGTTVQRGDLLMSAGDGTAMPQGDDLVRSKTIAKITSTHVSHIYDDGSYCVPCVLMAC